MKRNKVKNKTNKKIPTHIVSSLASILIIVGGFFIFNNYVRGKKIRAYDYMANVFYEQSIKETNEVSAPESSSDDSKTEESDEEVVNNNTYQVNYVGYLEIPKINLKKGFLDINDKDNNVETNIYVAPTSSYPDVDKGNLIIAGHSGTGWKAFFNNLYKLNKGDYLYITYKGKKYFYQIDKVYKQKKTGKISIYRDYEKTTLTLVTCTNNDSETQTVYVSYLVETQDI